ncbi:hypothetical protein [Psychrobacter sp. P11G5]|uniref:hypothetical protein n=1 Tax=Psychrobacter sp. P11G5 TaxID=1699624 RepID=UPI0011EA64F2|nr:hypothetical protein [Psychrobacter sp. P11G5]
MQMNKTTLIIGISLLLGITACQPPSDKTDSSDATSTSAQSVESPSTQPLVEAKTPKALTKALVKLSEKTLKVQLICTKLDDTINAIDNKSEIEDIHTVQRQIDACLPVADNAEILRWLEYYQAMYGRFLSADSSMDDEAFFTVMENVEQDGKLTVAQLKQVNPRVRYLISLVRSRADVSVRYMGEDHFEFHHDLSAMADMFTPYLPDDQSEFIQRMAQDNQEIFWFDTAIAISFEELVERAVFWEDFISRYPDSRFYDDANALLDTYRYLLFFGSENVRWIDDDIRKFYLLKDERLMMQLAKRTDSQLAEDVQKLLVFMEQSDSERHQLYPVPDKDENGHKINQWEVTHYQLNKALDIPSLRDTVKDRNCLHGVTCVVETGQ